MTAGYVALAELAPLPAVLLEPIATVRTRPLTGLTEKLSRLTTPLAAPHSLRKMLILVGDGDGVGDGAGTGAGAGSGVGAGGPVGVCESPPHDESANRQAAKVNERNDRSTGLDFKKIPPAPKPQGTR